MMIRKEIGATKFMLLSLVYSMALAFAVAVVVFQVGRLVV